MALIDASECETVVRDAVATIMGSGFTSVRIIATQDVTGTNGEILSLPVTAGDGSYFTQLGAVREWTVQQEHWARLRLERALNPAGGDSDGQDTGN